MIDEDYWSEKPKKGKCEKCGSMTYVMSYEDEAHKGVYCYDCQKHYLLESIKNLQKLMEENAGKELCFECDKEIAVLRDPQTGILLCTKCSLIAQTRGEGGEDLYG